MPFTLSHPAAVLPLLRRPFVPASLVAGAMAPDVPYFLNTLGVSETSPEDWYGPLLNATETHSLSTGLLVSLPLAVGLVAVCRMLRAPVTALLPPRLHLSGPERTSGLPAKTRHTLWLLVSALIGVASHLAWDSLTHADGFLLTHVQPARAGLGGLSADRLLQYASTAFGLAAVGRHLWRRRDRLRPRGGTDTVVRLRPATRWGVVTLLVAAPVLGGAVTVRDDFDAYRYVTEVDHSRPATVVSLGDGASETVHPSKTVRAPWGTLAEGVLTGAAKRAGASFAVALLLYSATWQIGTVARRPVTASGRAPSPRPAQDGK
ncbi:DUF4184 family protein [Streptomyces diastaticus]|uniref:DUF4184 family protein n=1 Tax=Streptomyces diastaticus TaxID=1956 RepID=UPI00344C2FB1